MNRKDIIVDFVHYEEPATLCRLYNEEMEVQVLFEEGAKHPSEADFKCYTDGLERWPKAWRIPRNAKTDPSDRDYEPSETDIKHFLCIGLSGWNWKKKQSHWVGIDIDSCHGHGNGHDQDTIDAWVRKLSSIPWITRIYTSKSGKGIHCYVHFAEPVPGVENHDQHKLLSDAVIQKIESILNEKIAGDVADVYGRVLWIWHKDTRPGGYKLLHSGKKMPLDLLPSDWRDRVPAKAESTEAKGTLDAEHKKMIEYLEGIGASCEWDEEKGLLRTHTVSVGHAHKALGLKGPYATSSPGTNLSQPNCFCYPHRNGSWLVTRFSQSPEPEPWFKSEKGNYCCWINREEERFKFTDQDNAEALIKKYGDIIRFCPQFGWMFFNGKKWETDAKDRVYLHAVKAMLALSSDWSHVKDEKFHSRLRAHVHDSQTHGKINAIIDSAAHRCTVKWDQFDQKPWLFNAQNGTIDLRTGEMHDHDPKDLLTQISPFNINPFAKCTTFLEGFELIWPTKGEGEGTEEERKLWATNRGMLRHLQRVFGYALSGDISEAILPILYGPSGRNGKSELINAIMGVMGGDYAGVMQQVTLTEHDSREAKIDLAYNWNKRLLAVSEPDDFCKLSIAAVKMYTGNDSVSCRGMYSKPFHYVPQYKVVISTNHEPIIPAGGDPSTWARITEIPFDNVSIPIEKRILNYGKYILEKEGEGILMWLIEGAREYCAAKLARDQNPFAKPQKVEAANEEYRTSQDYVRQFVKDRCVTGDRSDYHTIGEIFEWFQGYLQDNDLPAISKDALTKKLKFEPGLTRGTGSKRRGFYGIRKKETQEVREAA